MEPTVTTVITWVAGALVTGLVTYLFLKLGKMEDKHDALDKEFRDHLASLPLTYVPQAGYREDLREIKDMLREMREEQRESRRATSKGARRAIE